MQLFNVSFICYRFLLGILFICYFIFLFSLHSPVSWIWPSPLLPLLLSPWLWSQRSPLPQEACLPELPPSFWHSPTWRQRGGKRMNKCNHSCQEVSFFFFFWFRILSFCLTTTLYKFATIQKHFHCGQRKKCN